MRTFKKLDSSSTISHMISCNNHALEIYPKNSKSMQKLTRMFDHAKIGF